MYIYRYLEKPRQTYACRTLLDAGHGAEILRLVAGDERQPAAGVGTHMLRRLLAQHGRDREARAPAAGRPQEAPIQLHVHRAGGVGHAVQQTAVLAADGGPAAGVPGGPDFLVS